MLCVSLLTNTQNTSKLSVGHRQPILHPWNDQLCAPNMTNTGHKASSHQVSGHCQWSIWLHYLNKCYLLTNTSLMTNFVFSRTAYWHIMHATHSNCSGANSQDSTSLLFIMAFNLTAHQWSLLISSHLLFFKNSCQTQLCVQSSYTYAYNKNAMVTKVSKVSTYKFDLKIASV